MTGVRSVLVQFGADALGGAAEADVDVTWGVPATGAPAATAPAAATYASASFDSPEVVQVVSRTIANNGGTNTFVETNPAERSLFSGREPNFLATFPPGYLASSGILGEQVSSDQAHAADFAGLSFFSDNLKDFALSGMYVESYKLDATTNPSDPTAGAVLDPVANYEGWLYDRCATFLTAYSHWGDVRFLRHAFRSCSYYSSKISLDGPNPGYFSGKTEPDLKYSHLRGLYAYYALTGDEGALASGKAMAEMWYTDPLFATPYRQGHVRGPDKLWTERLLGASLEGLYYGHALTGDPKYLVATKELFETAYKHITGDAAALAQINPGYSFPPQNCFVHSALQHEGDDASNPWCSGWMSELMIDPLLRYQEQTGDSRVDEVFVRLARFLRDVGSDYMGKDPLNDSFLQPTTCYDPAATTDARRLVPLYGAGIRADGSRYTGGDYDDGEHCPDATALTAAAIRGLVHQGKFDAGGPIGPFPSEGASFVAMHNEFAACAKMDFTNWVRTKRDPAAWTSAELAAGASDPAAFIASNKIGFPSHPTSPLRKLSWWFNTSMLEFELLKQTAVRFPTLTPGVIKGPNCP
jgi:hypothetical protein